MLEEVSSTVVKQTNKARRGARNGSSKICKLHLILQLNLIRDPES